mmetsp:Transcript_64122/g.125941  ORF Transcript_64122/g.125941 Transcript_64122/m.125941 type:complete len:112 (+) Transcript_64122:99-434(+)
MCALLVKIARPMRQAIWGRNLAAGFGWRRPPAFTFTTASVCWFEKIHAEECKQESRVKVSQGSTEPVPAKTLKRERLPKIAKSAQPIKYQDGGLTAKKLSFQRRVELRQWY